MLEVGVQAQALWVEDDGTPKPALLPAMLRRRTSRVTRVAAHLYEQVCPEGAAVPIVFGSALGELDTTMVLLAMMNDGDGALSPTKFHNSVHNTATGYLGIAAGNRAPSTAVAAGAATVAMTLLEAALRVRSADEPVVALLVEEPPPEPFAASGVYAALGAGFALVPPRAGAPRLRLRRADRRQDLIVPQVRHENPCQSALELARAVATGMSATVELGGGYVAEVGMTEAAG